MLRASAAVLLCGALCAPSLVHADDGAGLIRADGASGSYDAQVLEGTRKIVVRDFAGAVALLRDVASRQGSRPEAYCRLGDAQLGAEVLDEARAAYQSCERFATTDQNTHHVALALVGQARVFERENKPKEEREIWQRVALTVREPAAVTWAQGRLLVLDAILTQAGAQEQVRARIVERAALNAKPE